MSDIGQLCPQIASRCLQQKQFCAIVRAYGTCNVIGIVSQLSNNTSHWKTFGRILVNLALASRLIFNKPECLFPPISSLPFRLPFSCYSSISCSAIATVKGVSKKTAGMWVFCVRNPNSKPGET